MSNDGRIRIGFEFHPHIMGGTENFLRRLFAHLDATSFTVVAMGSAPGPWQELLPGIETHVVPYLVDHDTPADVAGAIRELNLDLVQSSCFSPVMALAAAQNSLPHVWRLGGHVNLLDRTQRERDHFLAIVQLTSQRVVCPSRFLRSQMPCPGFDACTVIYNGIDLAEIPPPPAPNGAGGAPRVAVLAHLVPSKRHEIFLHAARRVAQLLSDMPAGVDGLHAQLYADVMGYLPSDLLTKMDRMSMRCSLEVRVPFLNHPLAEFVWSLPSEVKHHGGVRKVLLRQLAARRLPAGIVGRAKQGFAIPMDIWMWQPGRFRDLVYDTLRGGRGHDGGLFDWPVIHAMLDDHDRLRGLHGHRLWTVFVLQRWLERA